MHGGRVGSGTHCSIVLVFAVYCCIRQVCGISVFTQTWERGARYTGAPIHCWQHRTFPLLSSAVPRGVSLESLVRVPDAAQAAAAARPLCRNVMRGRAKQPHHQTLDSTKSCVHISPPRPCIQHVYEVLRASPVLPVARHY